MSYYEALGFQREPFPNSPTPDLLYRSPNHLECLRHMEIAIRLRRGLNVVLGEVGTGKSTLCRELVRVLAEDADLTVRVLDDPFFEDPADFLAAVARLFGVDVEGMRGDQVRLREAVKIFLGRQSEAPGRIVTLLVDEGQKITGPCLELLRELLNFECDTHKLLQIVIFAQTEFEEMLSSRPNLADRVNFHYVLRPLTRRQTRAMVEARLTLSMGQGARAPRLFTGAALRRIYRLTGGYPRKIVRLCHVAMLLAVGHDRKRIGRSLVGQADREMRGELARIAPWRRRLAMGLAYGGLAATLLVPAFGFDILPKIAPPVPIETATADASATTPVAVTVPVDGWTAPAAAEAEALAEAAPASEGMAAQAEEKTPVAPEAAQAQSAVAPEAEPQVAAASSASATPATSGDVVPQAAPAVPSAPVAAAPATPDVSPQPASPARTPATPSEEPDIVILAPDASPASKEAAAVLPEAPSARTTKPALPETLPAVAAAAGQAESCPTLLGEVVTPAGTTAVRQANRVYGASNRHIFDALSRANPGVDFSRIRAGQKVNFPAVEASPLPAGACLVVVNQVGSLEQGLAELEAWRKGDRDVSLTLFVTYQPDSGLHFDVVQNTLHPDAASASAAMVGLPQRLAATAKIVEHYPQGTVFFTEMGLPDGNKRSVTKTAAASERRQVAATETR